MMKDYYDDYEQNKMNERPIPENDRQEFFEAQQSADAQDVYTAQQSTDVQEYEDITGSSEQAAQSVSEGSYEWNASDGEYRHSYINGNNSTASHNPNNYEDAYSTRQDYGYQSQQTTNPYDRGYQNPYSGYTASQYQTQQNTVAGQPEKKQKKERKPLSRGFIAAMLSLTVVASAALGFGGGFLAKNLNSTTSGNLTINQANPGSVTNTSSVSSNTTSSIVKKTADSVVEIATEGLVNGSFARQYVTKGAGSGVIISADGYIVTNHHVIDGANTITVTLRDGTTQYDATLIGSDADNDIALLKVDAEGLTPATFGDSSSLAVGDYVVAIGNPLGTLGGTVTDGIISALAREVTIEDKNMTLLQTNAQISPGNSGGGLFNANGELVGIVNAKDSGTEVEGIAFAIPVNNVIDVIKDLQNYGYVTGKIDLGMEFVDINSNDTAFYYGVNDLGCYVLSVGSGSNAESAGFKRGDLIVAVNDTNVSSSADISKALEDNKVVDTVKMTVKRNGKTSDLSLTLAEYKPSAKLNEKAAQSDNNSRQRQSGDDLWKQIFGW